MNALRTARVLLVGAGGLGSPVALALVRAGVGSVTIVDDDVVDASNLHRQTVFEPEDAGHPKAPAAVARLRALADRIDSRTRLEAIVGRFLPDNALELARAHDLVVDGADNFATKFLVADASSIAGTPSVQAGAVRWSGWALATIPGLSACVRCVFEDIPEDRVETCAEAGVVGPVVGVVGGIEALLAVRALSAVKSAAGELWSYRGLAGTLRRSAVGKRPDCPLCTHVISTIDEERYLRGPSCAA